MFRLFTKIWVFIKMEKEEFEKLEKEGIVKEEEMKVKEVEDKKEGLTFDLEEFIVFLEGLRMIKKHRTSPPTNIPKNFLEQIEFMDDGVNRRLYLYVNKAWRYVALN